LLRNSLLKHIVEGKIKGGIEVTGRQGRRRKQPLDDLKDARRYRKLKEEALLSHSVENSVRGKSLWTCRKTDYGMNE
jgi:hypothetical protein